jgi:alpha-beta hydrolase superfamily lysophospholipase
LRVPAWSWRGALRGVGRVFLGIVIGILIFVAFSAVMRAQSRTLPAVTGAAAVGRTELALNDAGRADPFATDGRSRELAVWIWYPTTEGASGDAAPYLPAAWAPLVNDLGPLSQDLTAVQTNSIANAPLDGEPPVVVLMPGLGAPIASYSALAEDLASHGYAVVGINPTGSADVVFPDGHLVPATPAGGVTGMTVDDWYASAERVTNVWQADADFVVTTLAANPPAIGALDFSRVAYVGHSSGGAAAFEACHQDTTCAGAVNLDGTLWTEVRQTGLEAPSLLIQKAAGEACAPDSFCSRAQEDFATVAGSPNAQWYAIAGSQHQSFSDSGLLWGPATASMIGPIEGERMTEITRDLVRSFLDVHVLGAPAETFTAATARYSEVSDQEAD